VKGLDTAAPTLRIGDSVLDHASASNVPATLANGQSVNLRLAARGSALAVEAFSDAVHRPGDAPGALVGGLAAGVSSPAPSA
jgi:hypothetical protein